MNPRSSYAQRKSRGGKGLIPPNPKQWENEHNGLDLRDALSVNASCALSHLSAFELLPNTVVLAHGEMPFDASHIDHLRNSRAWSGIAIPVPDAGTVVVFNDGHAISRVRATLMEEFFHLWLGHPASNIRIYSDGGSSRTFNHLVESEAYGSGAAALVPYQELRKQLEGGSPPWKIAEQFEVSEDLVLFRMKVTKLWRFNKRTR